LKTEILNEKNKKMKERVNIIGQFICMQNHKTLHNGQYITSAISVLNLIMTSAAVYAIIEGWSL